MGLLEKVNLGPINRTKVSPHMALQAVREQKKKKKKNSHCANQHNLHLIDLVRLKQNSFILSISSVQPSARSSNAPPTRSQTHRTLTKFKQND